MIMYWVSLLAISILLYVLLDGFDLGIGILFGLTRDEARRHAMWGAVAPIWDGNETWLVVTAVILWGAFPAVYAMLLPAFYLPLVVMLSALILRGVAFEFRYKAERMRWIWDFSFFGGSLVATFVQGMTVGALVEGLPITNGEYAGGDFGWFSPFAAAEAEHLVARDRIALDRIEQVGVRLFASRDEDTATSVPPLWAANQAPYAPPRSGEDQLGFDLQDYDAGRRGQQRGYRRHLDPR